MTRLYLALVFVFLGCHPVFGAEPLRVALMLEHEEPSAWTELLCKGLKQGGDQSLQTDVVIAPKTADQTAIFRDTAKNHDLVIVASENLFEILRDNAANFRKVKFGVVDAGIRAPNIMCVTFADEQAAYLAGVAAALLASESGPEPVIGWLSGADTPAMRSLFNGYTEGALLAVPGCRVIQAVAGSFTDAALAAAKADWLLKAGARVLAIASGAGSTRAVEVAQKAGVPFIELDAANASGAVGVIAKAADRAVAEIISSARSANFGGKQILVYDLANGGVNFTGLDKYLKQHRASERVGRRVGELRHELAAGAIRVPSLRQRTLCDCLD